MLLKIYDKLVAKVNSIDTSGFVSKTKYDADKKEIENKIAGTSSFVKKTFYNAKIIEIEGKIPTISGLATNAALIEAENKIPHISNLVGKKLLKLKRNLLILIMINKLQLQCLIP